MIYTVFKEYDCYRVVYDPISQRDIGDCAIIKNLLFQAHSFCSKMMNLECLIWLCRRKTFSEVRKMHACNELKGLHKTQGGRFLSTNICFLTSFQNKMFVI